MSNRKTCCKQKTVGLPSQKLAATWSTCCSQKRITRNNENYSSRKQVKVLADVIICKWHRIVHWWNIIDDLSRGIKELTTSYLMCRDRILEALVRSAAQGCTGQGKNEKKVNHAVYPVWFVHTSMMKDQGRIKAWHKLERWSSGRYYSRRKPSVRSSKYNQQVERCFRIAGSIPAQKKGKAAPKPAAHPWLHAKYSVKG